MTEEGRFVVTINRIYFLCTELAADFNFDLLTTSSNILRAAVRRRHIWSVISKLSHPFVLIALILWQVAYHSMLFLT